MIIYKFLNAEYALKAIKNGLLKVSEVDKLNDPFEFNGVIYIQATENNNDSLIKIMRKLAIGCFSKNFSNPTMWSHYSDSHKGIVLGYEVSSDLKENLHSIHYKHRKIKIYENGHDVKKDQKLALKFLKLKSKDWGYENEARALFYKANCIEVTNKGQTLFFIDCKEEGLILKEVILGVNSGLEPSEICLCGLNVHIYKASLCKFTYTILRTLQPRPYIFRK